MNHSRLVLAILTGTLLAASPAGADPQDPRVRAGQVDVGQSAGTTTVHQLTERAIVDWRRFSIGTDELVRFVQPSELAVILNRVVGADPSLLLGRLQANGQVFLVNPNGILFGPGSRVDVGSLVATTLSLSDEDFLRGDYRFRQDPRANLAAVVNQGELRVSDHGYVVLAAPLVSNEGLIVANLGHIALGAGQEMTVNLDGRQLVNFRLSQTPTGEGTVVLTPEAVSSMLGQVVEDDSLVPAGALVEEGGVVRLIGAEGLLVQAGTLQVGSPSGSAGTVELDASQVAVLTRGSQTLAPGLTGGMVDVRGETVVVGGLVDASGSQPGGRVRLGGDPSGREAVTTRILPQAVVRAEGQGGTIVVWSESLTEMAGTLHAGDAGLVETSSRHDLVVTGSVLAGVGGEWLVDPANLTIATTAGVNQLSNATINASLNAGTSVILSAQSAPGTEAGNIVQNADAPITKTSGGNAVLGLTAGVTAGTITLNGDITSSSNGLRVVLRAGSSTGGDVTVNGTVATNGGGFVSLGHGTFTNNGLIDAGSGDVTVDHGGSILVSDIRGSAITLNATGGSIEELTPDPGADLTSSFSLDMVAANGIGALDALEAQAPLIAQLAVTASGDLALSDLAPTATVSNASTLGGSIWLQGASLTGSDLHAEGGGITILSSLTSLGLLQATGDVTVVSDALNLTSVVAGGGVSLTSTAGIALDRIEAGGDVTLTATSIQEALSGDPDLDILADGPGSTLTLTSGESIISGVQGLEVQAHDIILSSPVGFGDSSLENVATQPVTVTFTGGANFSFAQTGNQPLSVPGSNGNLTVTNTGGELTLDMIVAGLLSATTLVSGDIRVGLSTASSVLDSAGAIVDNNGASPNFPSSPGLGLQAVLGIGAGDALEINSSGLTAHTTSGDVRLANTVTQDTVVALFSGSGSLNYQQTGGRKLTGGTVSAGGDVILSNDGAIELNSTQGANITVTATGGDIEVGQTLSAPLGIVTLTASGSVLDGAPRVSFQALGAVLSAGNAIDLANPTAFDVATLTASAGAGGIAVTSTGGDMVVSSASSSGSLALTTNGSLTVPSASATGAGSDVTLSATGDLLLGSVLAADAFTATAQGSLLDTNGALTNVTASGLVDLNAGTGIGPGDALEMDGLTSLSADSTNGDIGLTLSSSVTTTATSLTTGTGEIRVSQTGNQILNVTLATTGDGNITLSNAGHNLVVTTATAGGTGDVSVTTTTSGNVTMDRLRATGDDIVVTSAGSIGEIVSDISSDLIADTITLTAGTAIGAGSGARLGMTPATDLTTSVAASGGRTDVALTIGGVARKIDVTSNAGVVNISAGVGGDSVQMTAAGALTAVNTGAGTILRVSNTGGPITDGGAALDSETISLIAASGIGAGDSLEIAATTLAEASVTGSGAIDITNSSGGLGVLLASTNNGSITLLAPGGTLGVTSLTAGGASLVTLTSTGATSDVNLGSVTSGDDVTITAGRAIIDANGAASNILAAGAVDLNAAIGIGAGDGLEISGVSSLTADTTSGNVELTTSSALATTAASLTTSTGNILVQHTGSGGLSLGLATTTDGSISVGVAGGALTVNGPVSAGGAVNGDVTLTTTTSGDLVLGGVTAADDLTVTAAGAILDGNGASANLTADGADSVLTLTAGLGIGAADALELVVHDFSAATTSGNLELSNAATLVTTATALTTGTGDIALEQTGADLTLALATTAMGDLTVTASGNLTVSSATAADGDIGLSTVGALTVTSLAAGGADGDVNLTTSGAGNVGVGLASATDTLTVSSGGNLTELGSDPSADLLATQLALVTVTGIGGSTALQIDATGGVAAQVTGAGPLALLDLAGGLTVTSATTANGSIRLTAQNGPLSVATATAGGVGRHVILATVGAGSLAVGDLTALDDSILLTSASAISASGPGSVLASKRVSLTAASGIGPLTLDTVTVTNAVVTGTGGIDLSDLAGGLTVTNVSTHDGSITLAAAGLTVTSGNAGGAGQDFTASSTGDLLVGRVVASGDSIFLQAGGAILEAGADPDPDLLATDLDLQAAGGIGAAGATVETEAVRLTAVATGPGRILVSDTDNLNVVSASTVGGNINVTTHGLLRLGAVSASDTVIGTSVTLGNITVDNVTAVNAITLTAVGSIAETTADPATDLTAPTLTLAAGSGIGPADALEIDANNLSASVSGTGGLRVVDTSGAGTLLTISNATATNGDVDIAASGGSLRADHVSGSNVTLTTNTTGSIQVDEIAATGSVTLSAAQNITEIGVDPDVDVTAGAASVFRALAGVIATTDALEVQVTQLSLQAGGSSGGASIKLAGLVGGSASPTASLIHLNTPPGTSTFNGTPF